MENKQNKGLPPVSTTLGYRAKWMWELVKLRNYSFSSNEQRNTYLYIYYLTLKQAYGSLNFAKALTYKRNRQLGKALKESTLDKKIKIWNLPENNRIFTNEKIIRLLEITPEEDELLKISYNKKMKNERARRTELRHERNNEILLMSRNGRTQKQIAEDLKISISTVKRVLHDARPIKNSSFFTINRRTSDQDARKEFISVEAQKLYSLYKTEKELAPVNEFQIALEKLKHSRRNIFLGGSAGTGKSTLINTFLDGLSKKERKKVLVLAPTGKASDIINGQTIHSAFELSNGVMLPDDEITIVPKALKNIDTVIIDEISMVRADIFDKVMRTIQFAEKEYQCSIRVIAVGDFGQLKPPASSADKELLKLLYPHFKGHYAFYSPKWHEADFERIILYRVLRQEDEEFINRLTGIKYGRLEDLYWLKENSYPFMPQKPIYICSKNKTVEGFNNTALELYGKDNVLKTYVASYDGDINLDLPCPETLKIGIGVRIMTICNQRYFKNGMIGTVTKCDDERIVVKFDNGKTATIKRVAFTLENGTVYLQFPITLAYAISAHKSQGSTFNEVAVICDGYFEAGQLYCAISRCKNFESLIFINPPRESDLKIDIEALKMTIYNK